MAVALQERDSTKKVQDQKEAECQEVSMMLKEVVEENSQLRADLKVRME